eukprot:Selendium_serpulae@DN8567_c0_g1_i1.p1
MTRSNGITFPVSAENAARLDNGQFDVDDASDEEVEIYAAPAHSANGSLWAPPPPTSKGGSSPPLERARIRVPPPTIPSEPRHGAPQPVAHPDGTGFGTATDALPATVRLRISQ